VKGDRVTVVLSAGPQQWRLPSVRGKSVEDGQRLLRQISPLIRIAPQVKPEHSETVPSGQLIRTSPAARTYVTVDDVITLYQSIGPPIIAVPTIDPGTAVADAKARLTAKGFEVRIAKPVVNTSVPPDTVVSVYPNTRAPKGSTITITPCKGVTVPSFDFGSDYAAAAAELQQLGLVPVLHQTPLTGGSRIISQSPEGGTRLHVGDSVDLYVA
jgi:beta-lactam-binding protein with PASTA domain